MEFYTLTINHSFSSRTDKNNIALNVSLQHTLSVGGQLNVNFSLNHGDKLAVFGSSGSGKTTLLRIISGLAKMTSGVIDYRGNIWNERAKAKPVKKIAYVPQSAPLIPSLTVAEHLHFAAKRAWQNKIHDLSNRLVDELELALLLKRQPMELSGGERQRVCLACALLQQATLLLLDEPFSALDHKLKSQAQRLVSDIQQDLENELIIVSHSLSELFTLADKALVIEQGKQESFGDIESTLEYMELDDPHKVQVIQGKVVSFKDANGKLCERGKGVWAVLECKLGELLVPIQDFEVGKICVCSLSTNNILITSKDTVHSTVNSFKGRIENIKHDDTDDLASLKVRVNEYLVSTRIPKYKLANPLFNIGNNVDVHIPQLKII